MAWPFFSLVPPSPREDASLDYQASLTTAELTAFQAASEALCAALHEALDVYCAAHEPTMMSVCIDAARCLVFCLERQSAEDNADA